MALSSQSIKNLKGGISQQPDILRYPNQGARQVNGWSSETKGLQKRPPSVKVARLGDKGTFGTKPLIHLINRDAQEQYYAVFTQSGVRVIGLDGREFVVNGNSPYTTVANPRDTLRLLTVADYTFIVNRDVTVEMGSELTHPAYGSLKRRALITVRGGQYGRTLKVKGNGIELCSYTLPSGLAENNTELSKQVAAMDSQAIAKELVKLINEGVPASVPPGGTAAHGFTAAEGPNHVVLTHSSGTIDTVGTEDGYADQLISSMIYQVQTTVKLPIGAPDGYLVEITGEASRSGDNYWVRYDGTNKVWKETAKPGIISGLSDASMPHAMVREADGTFTLKQLEWTKRSVGDDETSPMPSLIDQKVNDIFFYRNRLGFLAGENVVMSRTGRYFQLFTSSVAATSDDDPIDVSVSHNRISILKFAVPFTDQLLLWSDQAQFVLTSSGALSAKTAQLDLTSEFDVINATRPFGLGRGVYFAAPRAKFSSVKRYYAVADVSNVKNAEDISGHVPTYIPNTVHNLHGSGTENFISCLTDGQPERLFVYKFLYQDEQLAQQSWSHWEFGKAEVLASASIGSYMYIIMDRKEGTVLERIEFTTATLDYPEEPFRTFVDGKVLVLLTQFDQDRYETFFDIRDLYGGNPDGDLWVIDDQGWAERVAEADRTDNLIRLRGDLRGKVMTVGRAYKFEYEFSKFLIKTQADDGTVSTEDSGRLQLRKVWLNFEDSGAFEIDIWNGRNNFRSAMTGPRLTGGITLGKLNLASGQHRFSVTGNAREQQVTAWSDNPQPLNIIGCGFEGNYIRRSNGI